MDTYYTYIQTIRSHYNCSVSRSAKSQHLSTMKKQKENGKHSSANNMVEYISEMPPRVMDLQSLTIQDEITCQYNRLLHLYGNRHFTNFSTIEHLYTIFNRNYMMVRPLVNVNQLKLYDKRLSMYVNTNTINMNTIHFLIFLHLYTE